MTRRDRDLNRLLSAIAAEAGARLVEIRKTNGGHIRSRRDTVCQFNAERLPRSPKHESPSQARIEGLDVNDLFGPTSSAPVVGLNAEMPSPCRQCGGVDTTDQHHLAVTRIAN